VTDATTTADSHTVATSQKAGSVGATTERPTVSTRDADDLRDRLSAWFAARPDVGPHAGVESFERPDTNGMSSETLLFDGSWDAPGSDGGRESARYVARLCPEDSAFPVFPSYDMGKQARVMRLVGERSDAPVPTVRWDEPDESHLGGEFFVMDRVDGQVPPDVMPYTFDGSWVTEATPEQRRRMQAASVRTLAAIHGVEATPDELAFLQYDTAGETPLRRQFAVERAYYEWTREGRNFPVIERGFEWLEQNWPTAADASEPRIVWGDSRIGNILYQDFEPAAVLDWEMATVGPRELDIGWMVFLHRFFEDITAELGMAGLPDFLDRHDVAARYAELSGYEPQDLDWFITYAAVRHGSIMVRVLSRSIHFGEQEAPADPQDLVMPRKTIDALVEGRCWAT
jgi:aminoglycoside phosphotransferase (APT) family kinase protein